MIRSSPSIFTLLALLLAPSSPVSAQKGPVVPVSGASPFAGNTIDLPQTGTLYSESEVEPWVAVNPVDPNHLVAAWQQDRWSNGGARGLVSGVSRDGGLTWRSAVLPGLTRVSGGPLLRASDPWVTIAPNGDTYHLALAFGSKTINRNALLVNKSVDGGLTWGSPIKIIEDTPEWFNDKESITADPTDSRTVYAVWDRVNSQDYGPTWFSRTTDGGQSWEPARMIHDPGPANQTLANQIVVLPNGVLACFFTTFPGRTVLALKRSLDKGQTWGPLTSYTVVAEEQPVPVINPDNGNRLRTANGIFDVAVDASSGILYAVWEDARFSSGVVNGVAFSQSADGGLTWTAPIKVSQTPSGAPAANGHAFLPSVAVALDGTIAVSYYDFRRNTTDPSTLTDHWVVRCRPSTANPATDPSSWGSELRVTETSFDLNKAPISSGQFIGDYVGLAASGAEFVAVFTATNGIGPASIFSRRLYTQSSQGDADGDGSVTLRDSALILRLAGGLAAATADQAVRGDLAGRPGIELADAVALVAHRDLPR